MRVFFLSYFVLLFATGEGQQVVKGVVVDHGLNKPLPNAIVFLSGTSFGTKTNEIGSFEFRMPPGKYNLVAVCRGFETYSQVIEAGKLPGSISISLNTRSDSYEARKDFEKSKSNELRGLFILEFLGQSPNAAQCEISNIKSVQFYLTNSGNDFVAVTSEPLIIKNRALGYTVLYQLESFRCSYSTFTVSYSGYAFFQPLDGNPSKLAKWQKNRSEAYYGSLIHFMRSVYLNKIAEEGFEVRRLRKVLNLPLVAEGDSSGSKLPTTTKALVPTIENKEVNDYTDQVLNPDHYKEVIGMPVIGDSIAYAIDKTTAALDFRDFLLVMYRGKDAPGPYQMATGSSAMMSQLLLPNGRPVAVEANGSYYDAADLLILGYWSWVAKIPVMLPFDYSPPGN
ncbi:MAG: carboxypeptidase-like regulatory domain-containing protein [Flavisolibacter sp.]